MVLVVEGVNFDIKVFRNDIFDYWVVGLCVFKIVCLVCKELMWYLYVFKLVWSNFDMKVKLVYWVNLKERKWE